MTRRTLTAIVVAGLVVLAACSGDDEGGGPRRPTEDTSTTAVIDYSGVALGAVKGTPTTTTIPLSGTAAILGTVTGPSGPVGGATVRIERLVGSAPSVIDVVSGLDGHYEQRNLPGGRYRVRAFLPPALAQVEPQLQFVAAGAEQSLDLAMTDQRAIRARAAVAPTTPYVGGDLNLAVVIGTQRVDADGVVRAEPVIGVRVELDGLGAWTLRSSESSGFQVPGRFPTTTSFSSVSSVGYTDSLGQVRFALTCRQAGPPGLSVDVAVTVTPAVAPGQPPAAPVQQVQSIALAVPDCVDPYAVAPEDSTSTEQ
jgi:hypothetical protein